MKCLVINLPNAWERREAVARRFGEVGLDYALWPAVEGLRLPEDAFQSVDDRTRVKRGWGQWDRASFACLLSHLAVFRHLAESDDEMVAIFEDDARLHPDLPDVLNALEGKADRFDIVKLQRRNSRKRYFPVYSLTRSHSIGRVRYHDFGGEGYVITRHAAIHLLRSFPRPAEAIDLLISWLYPNGLHRIYYLNPPAVFHDQSLPSYIETHRRSATEIARRNRRRNPLLRIRRECFAAGRAIRRHRIWREIRAEDRKVDPQAFQNPSSGGVA